MFKLHGFLVVVYLGLCLFWELHWKFYGNKMSDTEMGLADQKIHLNTLSAIYIHLVFFALLPFLFQVTSLNLEIVRALARGTIAVTLELLLVFCSSILISIHFSPYQV